MLLTVLTAAFAFAAATLGVAVLGWFALERVSGDRRRAVARLRDLAVEQTQQPAQPGRESAITWAFLPRLGAVFVPLDGPRGAAARQKLTFAGYDGASALFTYVGLRVFLAATLVVGGLAGASAVRASWRATLLAGAAGAAVGVIAPARVLARRVRRRQKAIRDALPDALDILVMCLEGGVGLGAALNWLTDEIKAAHPLLGAELVVVQREVQLGQTVGEAFQSLADRCGVADVRELAAVIVQSERYGASMARAIRGHGDAARHERQMLAEETAQKASVKIVFPTMLCIFPAMFIVLLGPASIQMSKLFAR